MALVIGSTFWMLGNTQVRAQPLQVVYKVASSNVLPMVVTLVLLLQADARLFFGVSFMSVLFLAMG